MREPLALHDVLAERERAIEEERLVDLGEWARCRGLTPPLAFPSAVTRALWDSIEAIPFRLQGSVTPDDRVRHVARRARGALELWLKESPDTSRGEVFSVDFGAGLPRAGSGRRWIVLRLLGGPDTTGRRVLTIGLPRELPAVCDPGTGSGSPVGPAPNGSGRMLG